MPNRNDYTCCCCCWLFLVLFFKCFWGLCMVSLSKWMNKCVECLMESINFLELVNKKKPTNASDLWFSTHFRSEFYLLKKLYIFPSKNSTIYIQKCQYFVRYDRSFCLFHFLFFRSGFFFWILLSQLLLVLFTRFNGSLVYFKTSHFRPKNGKTCLPKNNIES